MRLPAAGLIALLFAAPAAAEDAAPSYDWRVVYSRYGSSEAAHVIPMPDQRACTATAAMGADDGDNASGMFLVRCRAVGEPVLDPHDCSYYGM